MLSVVGAKRAFSSNKPSVTLTRPISGYIFYIIYIYIKPHIAIYIWLCIPIDLAVVILFPSGRVTAVIQLQMFVCLALRDPLLTNLLEPVLWNCFLWAVEYL